MLALETYQWRSNKANVEVIAVFVSYLIVSLMILGQLILEKEFIVT